MICDIHFLENKSSGPRFPPMGHAYDRQYSSQMKQVAIKHNIELREGVYCALGNIITKKLNLDIYLFRIHFQVDHVTKPLLKSICLGCSVVMLLVSVFLKGNFLCQFINNGKTKEGNLLEISLKSNEEKHPAQEKTIPRI